MENWWVPQWWGPFFFSFFFCYRCCCSDFQRIVFVFRGKEIKSTLSHTACKEPIIQLDQFKQDLPTCPYVVHTHHITSHRDGGKSIHANIKWKVIEFGTLCFVLSEEEDMQMQASWIISRIALVFYYCTTVCTFYLSPLARWAFTFRLICTCKISITS